MDVRQNGTWRRFAKWMCARARLWDGVDWGFLGWEVGEALRRGFWAERIAIETGRMSGLL